ncbi:MAG: SAM hydrolase/SAM-dependent halogenase family protein [Candidatus Saccharicenans sp.]
MGKALVALLTDFGSRDYFVASLKGVILSINPDCQVIDLTHEIPDYGLPAAAFILWACYKFFPKETIFLTVVDPGVGSERRLILIKTDRYYFIAPDNGVLSLILSKERAEIYELNNKNYFITDQKTSFEGRDKMAPVAAWLSLRVPLTELGRPATSVKQLSLPEPQLRSKEIQGSIIYQDKFGNLITNISQELIVRFLDKNKGSNLGLLAGKKRISEMAPSYSLASTDKPFFMINSLGLLEIAVYKKSAAEMLGLGSGDLVVLKFD